MNINLSFLDVNCGSKTPAKSIKVRYIFILPLMTFFIIWAITACSSFSRRSLPGIEHLECSPEIHFINHNVTCERQIQGDWSYICEVNGSIENNGSGHASGVLVWMEFGREIHGVRSSTFNVIDDLDPGEKADFKSDFSYYELPTQYDIKIECADYKSAHPSPVPTPRNYFTNHGPKDDVFTLAIDHMFPTTLYAGTQTQGVFKSMDGGFSWVSTSSGLVNVKIGSLAIDPFLPTTIYAGTYGTDGTNGATYKSVDGGEHWIEITNGMGGAYIFSLVIDPLTPSTIYAGTSDGVFKSTNGGEKWRMLNTGIPEPYITHLIIDPVTPTNLYAVSSGISGRGLIKSTNSGGDWFVIQTDFSNTPILGLVINPLTPTTLYVGTSTEGVYKSIDAGENWNAVNTGLSNYSEVDVLIIDPVSPSILYAAIRDKDIYKSSNGGESWSALDTNLGEIFIWVLALNLVKPTIIYAGTESGVFVLNK